MCDNNQLCYLEECFTVHVYVTSGAGEFAHAPIIQQHCMYLVDYLHLSSTGLHTTTTTTTTTIIIIIIIIIVKYCTWSITCN